MKYLTDYCKDIDVKNLQTLSIAYVGDAYFHLFVRVRLLKYKYKVNDLHALSAKIVSAVYQSKAYQEIESMLTDEEREIFKRGRNAKSRSTHSATSIEYHNSTGFETLLGTLYLKGDHSRLDEMADKAFNVLINELNEEDI